MKAVFDYDILAKIKTALVSYMIIRELAVVRYIENNEFTDEDMVDIAHTYSKDIATMQFINHLGKAYRISDFYHNIYKNQDLTNISNPTSSFTNV